MSDTSCTASDPRFRSPVPVGKAKPGGGSLSAAVAVVLGLALTLTAAFLVAKWEGRVARQEFTAVSENHLLILQNGWNEYLNKLVALRAMFESSDAVTRVEFELFTKRMLRGLNAIQNFNWVPRVLNAERAAHERAAQHDGIPAYRIRYAPSHGTIVPSPERDEYLPVFYTTLPKTNRLYGLDLRSTIADKLDRARDLDELSCVPNWVLHSTDGATRGILLSLPVYRQGHVNQTVDDRRRNLAGFVHGAFLIREMMAEILAANTTPQGIDIYLFAADARDTDAPLYVHASRLRSDAADLATKAAVEAGTHWTGDIKLGDARWTGDDRADLARAPHRDARPRLDRAGRRARGHTAARRLHACVRSARAPAHGSEPTGRPARAARSVDRARQPPVLLRATGGGLCGRKKHRVLVCRPLFRSRPFQGHQRHARPSAGRPAVAPRGQARQRGGAGRRRGRTLRRR